MPRESTPIHLRPHAPVSERVLVPGDPGRAMRIATGLTDKPKMLNHNRGLWGYTGTAADGEPLTVQATGIGGPSAAIVVEELIDLGARRIVRVGTCGALVEGLSLGEIVVVTRALACDGASRALGAGSVVLPDGTLTAALRGDREVVAVTTDLFYDPDPGRLPAQAEVVEMEAAAVFAVCARRGVAAACVLIVSDLLAGGPRRRIGDEELLAAEERLGAVAWAAVAGPAA
jgi:uridine phosphorylase